MFWTSLSHGFQDGVGCVGWMPQEPTAQLPKRTLIDYRIAFLTILFDQWYTNHSWVDTTSPCASDLSKYPKQFKKNETWIGQVEFTGNTGTPCRTRMAVMHLGFCALCIVLRKTCMACIAAPETYEESHWCISTASYHRWRSCGSRGTTQVPMIPWWEYARTLTQQNADLKPDLNVQQILQKITKT